jgi:hypothetical protein
VKDDMAESSKSSYLVPREHGAWAMWIVPFLIGAVAAGKMTLLVPLLFGAALLLFFARTAFVNAVRLERRNAEVARWLWQMGAIELLAAAALGAPAVWRVGLPLVGIGAVAAAVLAVDLRWVRERSERSLFAELVAVAVFSASVLAGYAAGAERIAPEAWALWGICVAYFSGSIFYVKMRLERKSRPEKWFGPWAQATLAYAITATLIAVGFVALGWLRGWVVVALSPWLLHVVVDVLWPRPLQSIHRLGWTLVAHSVGFTLLAILFLQLG